MKRNKTLIKELRSELHYWQMRVRMDIYSTKQGMNKCREISRKMRILQASSPTPFNQSESPK